MSKRIIGTGVAFFMILGVFTGLMGQAPVDGGTWAPGGVMVAGARDGASPVLLDDGRVLVLGGRNADGAIASAEIYANGEWSQAPGVMEVWGHTATPLLDGRVLIAGGETASGLSALLDIFDPADQSLTPAGALWSVRRGHAATRLADGRVLIAGGFDGQQVVTSAEIFDPRDGSVYSAPFSLSVARAGLTATTLLDGRVLLAGGNDGENDLALVEIVDVSTGVVSLRAMGTARRDHSAVLLPNNNSVLLTGGVSPDGVLRSAELYIPWLDKFRATGSMVQPRHLGTLAALSAESYGSASALDGLVIAAGGAELPASELFRFAMVKADKDDYAPGDKVYISGSGWQPNEEIALTLREMPFEHTTRTFSVAADGFGRFSDVFLFDVEDHHLGVRFYLTARGAASQAQTTFTDAVFSLNPTSGVPGTVVAVSGGGWGANKVVTFIWANPAGTSVGTCSSKGGGNLPGDCHFTVPLSAARGEHTVYASSSSSTETATFTVIGPPAALVITSPTNATSQTVGTGFSAAVRSVDDQGSFSPVSSATHVTLSLKAGTGALSGTLTGSIPIGSSTLAISGIIYSKGETGVELAARRTNTNDWHGGSPQFTVGNPEPTLNSPGLSPNSGQLGETLNVAFTGTNFIPGVSSVNVGAGISVNSTTVTSATSLMANITIDANTTTGIRNFSVTNSGPGGGTSTVRGFSVNKRATSTTVTCFPNPVGQNQTATCTATVTDAGSGTAVAPTGIVTWSRTFSHTNGAGQFSGSDTASCTLSSSGTSARCSVTYTPTNAGGQGGVHAIKATYAGSTHNTSFGDTGLPVNTLPATTLGLDPASGTVGGTVTLSATLRNASTAAVISGTEINFRLNGASVGTATTNGSGVASLSGVSLAGIPEGTYPNAIAATFNGDTSFNGSTGSNTLTVQSAVSNQTISITTPAPAGAAYAGTFTVAATASSGLPVSITTSGVCSGSGTGSAAILMTSGAGTCTVHYNQAGNASFNAAPAVTSATTAQKADQVLTWGTPAGIGYGTALSPTQLNATTSGDGALTYSPAAGAVLGAGSQTLSVTAAATDNFNAGSASVTLAVAKAEQVLTWGTPAGIGYGTALSGTQLNATTSGDGALTYSPAAGVVLGAGSQTLSVTAAATDNFNAASTTVTLAVAKAGQTITFGALAGKTYGDAPFGVSAAASSGLPVSFSIVAGPATVSGDTVTITGAGSVTVRAAQGGNGDHEAAADVDRTFTIAKAAAVVAVSGTTVTYDGNAHGASGTATGVTGEDLASLLNLGDGFTNAPGGSASWSFAGDTNYAAQNGTAAIVINKATAVVAVNGTTVTYDGSAHGASGTATGVNGEDLASLLNLGASFTNAPGGSAGWSFAGDTNYAAQSGTAAIVINKAAAVVAVNGTTVTYDGSAHGASGSATGVTGENLGSLLDLGASFTNAPGGTASWSFAGDTNYAAQSGTAAIVINKATAVVAVSGTTVTYDGNAHGATGSATGLGGVDLSGALNLGASFTNAPGGTATWTFTDVTGNYNNASATVEIAIGKADATVVVTGYTGVYDGNAHGATGTATAVNNETLAGLNLGASFTSVPGGTANWVFTDVTGNYSDATGVVAITINQRPVTGTYTVGSKIYDGTTAATINAESLALSNVVEDDGPDNVNLVAGSATFASPNAGTHAVSGSGFSLAGDDALNYSLTSVSAPDATITAKGLTGSFTAAGKVYDGTATVLSLSDRALQGVVGTDDVSLVNGSATFANAQAGTHAVTGTGFGLTGTAAGNYTLGAVTAASATITAKGLTGSFTAGDKVFDGNNSASITGRSLAGVVPGEDVTLTGGSATFVDATVGSGKTVTGTGFALNGGGIGNYTLASTTLTTTASILYAPATQSCLGSAGRSILQPINVNGTSVFKQGSTVPAKFRVCDAYGNSIGTAGVVSDFKLISTNNGTASTVNEPVESTTPDTTFRWSATDQQWIFNMNTKKLSANQTYTFRVSLADGTMFEFTYGLK